MKKGFTLIELLVVIAILMILMTMLMPGAAYLREQAKRRQAASEAATILNAMVSYRTEYSKWPGQPDPNDPRILANPTFFWVLADTTYGYGSTADKFGDTYSTCSNIINVLTNPIYNPRDTMFLDLPANVLNSDGYAQDPWRRSYMITIDEDDNGIVTSRASFAEFSATINDTCSARVVIYSWGPDPAKSSKWVKVAERTSSRR